jgi:hypothetical protein
MRAARAATVGLGLAELAVAAFVGALRAAQALGLPALDGGLARPGVDLWVALSVPSAVLGVLLGAIAPRIGRRRLPALLAAGALGAITANAAATCALVPGPPSELATTSLLGVWTALANAPLAAPGLLIAIALLERWTRPAEVTSAVSA